MITIDNKATQAYNTIEVPVQTSFHAPEGCFAATIRSVRKTKQSMYSSKSIIRIIFELKVPDARIQYLAKLDLPANMNEGSDICNVICNLCGRRALLECSGSSFDLDSLVGLSCDVMTHHITDYRKHHEHPFVIVTDLCKPGELVHPQSAIKAGATLKEMVNPIKL